MALLNADTVVLGAGMVGVSAALHLQSRGRDVVLVDRRGAAGEETSFGNAGLIERASIFPHMMPRDVLALLRYGLNRSSDVHYHVAALPRLLPWLRLYWQASSPAGLMRSAQALAPLVERSLAEHEALAAAAGVADAIRPQRLDEALSLSRAVSPRAVPRPSVCGPLASLSICSTRRRSRRTKNI